MIRWLASRWLPVIAAAVIMAVAQGASAARRDGLALPEPMQAEPQAPRRARMFGGAVIVAGPGGYCIDPGTLQGHSDEGFAVIASCRILSGGRVGRDVPPVVITVAVGANEGNEALPSPAMLAALSGTELLSGGLVDGFVAANLADGGREVLEDGDPRHWRGAFLLDGRLVGLALYAPKGSEMTGPAGRDLLRGVMERIRELSSSQAAFAPARLVPMDIGTPDGAVAG